MPTTDPTVTRITLACTGDEAVVEQIKKQLDRLIDVIQVNELTDVPSLNRELMLVKVNAQGPQRGEIFQVADVFKAQIMDVGHDCMTVELAGSPEKIDDLISLLEPYGIAEDRAERRGRHGAQQEKPAELKPGMAKSREARDGRERD